MRRVLQTLALLSFLGLAFAACSGFSTEDATTQCDLERNAKGTCFNDATYTRCVSCYEECGDSCAVQESCPVQYLCAD
jgi:hypothetical protein